MAFRSRQRSRRPRAVAGLSLLVLWLAAGALQLSGTAAADVSTTYTLTTFTGGETNLTVSASGCVDTNVSFSLPWNASVTYAAFDATLRVGSLAPTVGLNATLPATLSMVDANVTLVPGVPHTVWLSSLDVTRALASAGNTSGQVDVFVSVTLCPVIGAFSVDFGNLNVAHWLRNPAPTLPSLLPGSPLVVQAGEAASGSIDLAPFFSDPEGDPLTYSATVAAAWDVLAGARTLALDNTSEAGIEVTFNGSAAEVRATNPYWWGQALIAFSARDASGNGAGNRSEHVLVEVTASRLAAANAHIYTEPGGRARGVQPNDCWSEWFDRMTLPSDAYITSFVMYADLYDDRPAFHGSIEILYGSTVLASFEAAEMPTWVGTRGLANLSGMAAYSGNASNPGPFVDLELAISICANAQSTTGALFTNISVIFWTDGVAPPYGSTPGGPTSGPADGTELPLPSAISLTFNGISTKAVESGSLLAIAATNGLSNIVDFNVSWSIDGRFVAYGPTLEGVTLAPGEHTIDVTLTNATVSRTFSTRVTASLPGGTPIPAWILAAVVGTALVGSALAGTQSGRWLILGVALGSVFARLKKASLLDHFVRGTLYQVIRENPGIHFAELRRRTGLPTGQASHHLRMLERGDYVRVVVDGMKTRFYPTDRPLEDEEYGLSDRDNAVMRLVADEPGITQRDLSVRLGRSASAVSRSISRLVVLGYVTTTRKNRGVAVYPREEAEPNFGAEPRWPGMGDMQPTPDAVASAGRAR